MSGKHTQKRRINPKILRRAILFLLSVFLLFAAAAAKNSLTDALTSQTAAKRWQSGDMRYTQISCFIDEDAAFSEASITPLRSSINTSLEAEAIAAESEDARLWIDAYSGETTLTVSRDGKSAEARAICTGGDFFYFHELDIMDGWCYSESDLMQDTVVIDRELAWQLFGAFELADMRIELNGHPCVIAGVSRTPESGAESKTYGAEPTVYLPYSLAEKLGITAPVTCYEAVLPNPVDNFGANLLSSALSLEPDLVRRVENTYRYSMKSCLTSLLDFAYDSTRTDTINYPYWENAAIYTGNWCRLLVIAMLLLAIYPAVIVCIVFAAVIKNRKKFFRQSVLFFKKQAHKKSGLTNRPVPSNTEEQQHEH